MGKSGMAGEPTGNPGWDDWFVSMHYQSDWTDYPRDWDTHDGKGYPVPSNNQTKFRGVDETTSMKDLLTVYVVNSIMRDRYITVKDIAKHWGTSGEAVGQMMAVIANGGEYAMARVELAIEEITKERGGVYAAVKSADPTGDQERINAWLSTQTLALSAEA